MSHTWPSPCERIHVRPSLQSFFTTTGKLGSYLVVVKLYAVCSSKLCCSTWTKSDVPKAVLSRPLPWRMNLNRVQVCVKSEAMGPWLGHRAPRWTFSWRACASKTAPSSAPTLYSPRRILHEWVSRICFSFLSSFPFFLLVCTSLRFLVAVSCMGRLHSDAQLFSLFKN